jgi:hypothetical protein
MLLGEAKREAPAQAELRPTCAGAELTLLEEVADDTPEGNAAEHWLIKC